MFQRLSNLLFGEVEEVAAELKGPRPSVTEEEEEEGWLIVNLTEGATAESSPMEDLLIEHPSMSVYVSPSNLSTVAEESMVSLAGSLRMTQPATNPATHSTKTDRGSRGAASQAGILAKVTQVSRVQRGKALIERRHLSGNRIQRQNRIKEKVPRRGAHIRSSFLHQPNKRNFYH